MMQVCMRSQYNLVIVCTQLYTCIARSTYCGWSTFEHAVATVCNQKINNLLKRGALLLSTEPSVNHKEIALMELSCQVYTAC